jgi:hypothetical protein
LNEVAQSIARQFRRIVGQQLLLAELNERIRDVKVGLEGAIYVLTDGENARLLRLTPTPGRDDVHAHENVKERQPARGAPGSG